MPAKPSALVNTRVIYCGDNLEQLRKLPDSCVDIDAFEAVMMREERMLGYFVGFEYYRRNVRDRFDFEKGAARDSATDCSRDFG